MRCGCCSPPSSRITVRWALPITVEMWRAEDTRARAPDEASIRSMFDGLVERYDLLNDVLSLGMDRWWRRSAAAALDADPGSRILDLGCGTGRLGELLAPRHPVTGV